MYKKILERLATSLFLGGIVALSLAGADCQAGGLKIALTFDDLPVAGTLPEGYDRDAIANSIIATLKARLNVIWQLKDEKSVYGAIETCQHPNVGRYAPMPRCRYVPREQCPIGRCYETLLCVFFFIGSSSKFDLGPW